jgi:hypothetical protein
MTPAESSKRSESWFLAASAATICFTEPKTEDEFLGRSDRVRRFSLRFSTQKYGRRHVDRNTVLLVEDNADDRAWNFPLAVVSTRTLEHRAMLRHLPEERDPEAVEGHERGGK